MHPTLKIFGVVAVLRFLNAISIITFFQPDEFYQALEPAHKLVYGYGYITWEWHEGLRSSLHPWLYALAYKAVGAVVSEDWAVYLAPRLMGAAVAAVGETYLYKFALKYTGSVQVATFALAASVLSGWNWFFITRAFSNNLEMVLTTVGLAYWPWNRPNGCIVKSCIFGFLSCIVRPTNALLWGFLGAGYVVKNLSQPLQLASLGLDLGVLFGVICALTALPDLFFYGKFTVPLYNFLEFNVVKNLSIFYGSAPWHFYLFQGIPLLLMGYLPLWAMSMWRYRNTLLVNTTLFVIIGFSCIAHKEFRFIYPLYPIFMVHTAQAARTLFHRKYFKALAVSVVLLHSMVAFFFTRINESGEIGVVNWLTTISNVSSVGFLTPCHSVPWHSSFHREDLVSNLWMLTCEPPLHLANGNLENVRSYRDESDRFFDNPEQFLKDTIGTPQRPWPSHLVIFQHMEDVVSTFLQDTSYKECARFFNSYFHWDPRRWGDIIVYCQNESL
ncbi:hypothetical protein FT663_03708 [Candidozyma haemuli var. vulneris]|uniref:Mannosyltransferase n=1 Tax=Candidozyma haemuli TaxID=45357 RepID=A0A2V1ASH5_9ASCO|nr:hypothetical protein CXQ85_004285 [[Candida] haemuloni]KAF3987709.1 hypothetical protein FT662_03844 [[Candida] haemuloni var. vulneris]KAF3989248.1 hypothetical protein FT663_03708 [[Candida] haemuloni var. vulneris]PVH20778.1 hypothetical protein CXQ85_004285 [[Candida] haemuloni]